MAGFKDTASEVGTTIIAFVLGAAVLLGVGWFIGFRPIEWIIDFTNATSKIDAPNPGPQYVNDPVPVEEGPFEAPPAPEPSYWSCYWDPTMNENWHDDVLCNRGEQYERPLLLTDWDFVTYDDMMAEAANYEAWLNTR